jgi:hypothetical protein
MVLDLHFHGFIASRILFPWEDKLERFFIGEKPAITIKLIEEINTSNTIKGLISYWSE